MSRTQKKFISVLLSFLIAAVCGMGCSALSANEYGLGLTASASENGSETAVKIELKNSNSFAVDNVKIAVELPSGVRAAGETSLASESLNPGERLSTEIKLSQAANFAAASVSSPDSPISMGGNTAVFFVVLAVAAAGIILAICRRKFIKPAALILTAVMLLPAFSMFSVHAVGIDESRSFTLEDEFTLNKKTYPINIKVDYTAKSSKNSYFELNSDFGRNNNETVNRAAEAVSGTAAANTSVESVSYQIRSRVDDYKLGSSGEIELNGCEWSTDKLLLKPGDNEVVITAVLADGSTQTDKINLTYDSGEVYRYTANDVKKDGETTFVSKVVNIYFEPDTAQERIDEILAEMNAVPVGAVNGSCLVQAKVSAESLEGLSEICKKFEQYKEVVLAGIEQIVDFADDAVTNDPWYYTPNPYQAEVLDEAIPGGQNWHVEAIQAMSAWDYNSYYSKVNVGIIDGGFQTDHEDFDDLIHFPTTQYKNENDATSLHGTHVSGIIGAAHNNGKGISGLLWNVDIYGANFYAATSGTISYVVSAVTAEVECGAKAVNLSLGLDNAYNATSNPNPYLSPYDDSTLNSMAGQCAAGMSALLQNYEFVIVQSAGNGVIDSRLSTTTYRSADATQNGLYCSIKKRVYGSLTLAQVTAVYDRIIVVGAAQNISSADNGAAFMMWYRSNGGDRVDIYAPGVNVFSTIAPYTPSGSTTIYHYAGMTGTSQSAPVVTSVAALCFSINPNLNGAQVKSMVCSPDNTKYIVYDNDQLYADTVADPAHAELELHPFTGDGRMVNMLLVAEAALRTVCNKASYVYLNSIVVAANKLNANDYTNYETVQAVIDSIDYNLFSFEQKKVDAKALELISAMDKLNERGKADYTQVNAAKADAAALNKDDYVDFSGVDNAVAAVVEGKYADEQAEVDAMAQAIRSAIDALVLKAEITSDNTDIVADNQNKVVVLTDENLENLSSNINASGGYTIEQQPNSLGTYSTGSTVKLTKDGCDDKVYTVAVLGDVNGDAAVDGYDAFLIEMYAVGMLTEPDGVFFIASDADCGGSLTGDDARLVENAALGETIINLYF